jgi:tetratricopeptide (TPR) repeat protein
MAKQSISKTSKEEVLIDVAEVSHEAQSFFETNKKLITYGGIALVVLVAAIVGWKYYTGTQNKKALTAMWHAEQMFERDSFALALNNPGGGFEGFQGIVSKYGSTDAGNLARYYAGVCYLNLGKFDEAIKYLEDFSPKGDISPTMKYGALGDAYSEKKDFAKALKNYKEAGSSGDIEELKAMYLKRYGMLSELQNDPASAISAYKEIKEKYGNTTDGRDIEKYLARAEAKKK